jgi:hypothetical protein
MNGGQTSEEKKSSPITLLVIIGLAIVFVVLIFAMFTPSSKSSRQITSIVARFNGNTTLKSNSFFNLNFTISNPYDISLENVRIWIEAAPELFSFSYNPLNETTTLRGFSSILPRKNVTYFLANVKVERVYTQMKNIPVVLKILYTSKISKNFTINVARKDALKWYGGVDNLGIKSLGKSEKAPFIISFLFDSTRFIFEKGKNEVATFKIVIEDVGGGKCIKDVKIKGNSNANLVCKYENNKFVGSFEFLAKPSKKIEIPCNYTFSYLENRNFDSVPSSLEVSCEYLETKTFLFTIAS